MSKKTPETLPPVEPVEPPVTLPPEPVEPPAPDDPDAPAFKVYATKRGVMTALFDILVKNQTIYGYWQDGKSFVQFNVPNELVPHFEKHHHFVVGNVQAK